MIMAIGCDFHSHPLISRWKWAIPGGRGVQRKFVSLRFFSLCLAIHPNEIQFMRDNLDWLWVPYGAEFNGN